jgi:hypothetical protein
MISGMPQGRFVVVRTHSGVTSKNYLWKVMSRPFRDYDDALFHKEYCEDIEKNKNHQFAVLEIK